MAGPTSRIDLIALEHCNCFYTVKIAEAKRTTIVIMEISPLQIRRITVPTTVSTNHHMSAMNGLDSGRINNVMEGVEITSLQDGFGD